MTLQEQFKEFQKSLRSHHAGSAAWFEVIDRCVDEMLSIHIEQLDAEATVTAPGRPRIDISAPDDVDVYVNGRLVLPPFSFGHKP
jgi:hypothetical protein